MARIAGKNANFSFVVAIEDELASVDLAVDVNLPEVTAFADTAQEFVEGKYGSSIALAGAADLAAAKADASLFGQIGSGEAAFVFDPTGAGPNTNNPTYNGMALVKSYRLRAEVGGAVTFDATLQVSGALERDVTP